MPPQYGQRMVCSPVYCFSQNAVCCSISYIAENKPGDHKGRPYILGDFEIGDIDVSLPDEALTAREREVLELLSRGLPNKLIARRLQISEHTVKFHVSSIYAKLGATSRTDAVSRGVRRGLITL